VPGLFGKDLAGDGGLSMQSKADMLTGYWMTDRGASLRVYRDLFSADNLGSYLEFNARVHSAPVGYSSCRDLGRTPLKWFKYYYTNVVYYNRVDECGHFFAWQNPELFSKEFGQFIFALHLWNERGCKSDL